MLFPCLTAWTRAHRLTPARGHGRCLADAVRACFQPTQRRQCPPCPRRLQAYNTFCLSVLKSPSDSRSRTRISTTATFAVYIFAPMRRLAVLAAVIALPGLSIECGRPPADGRVVMVGTVERERL